MYQDVFTRHKIYTKVQECDIVVSKFRIQSCYYVCFYTNALGKDFDPPYLLPQIGAVVVVYGPPTRPGCQNSKYTYVHSVHPFEEYQNITLTVDGLNECDLWHPQEEGGRWTIT